MCSVTRDRKGLVEVFKRLPVPDYLLGDPVLSRDGDNIGIVLSPDDFSLMKVVKLRKKEQTPDAEIHHPGNCVQDEPQVDLGEVYCP